MAEKVSKLSEKVEKIDDLTPVQKLAKLDAERAEILASAKADALQKANEAVGELNALGFHYVLSEEGTKANGATKGTPSSECPICKMTTDPPHDKRSHKKHPEAFTEDELKQRGYVRVQ